MEYGAGDGIRTRGLLLGNLTSGVSSRAGSSLFDLVRVLDGLAMVSADTR
jgi:hypothetical protein